MDDVLQVFGESAPYVALLFTLIAAVWVLFRFHIDFQAAARKPFLEKQLEFCIEAATATAQLATTQTQAVYDRAASLFWELYWGRLAIVEDRRLEAAMVRFRIALEASGGFEGNRESLTKLSLAVAHASRDLIRRSWSVDLGPLVRQR